jgi:ADP-ribose pyrophosphatase
VNARVIELPAGLAGDEPGGSNEEASAAARRELLEETGYEAAELRQVFEGVTSAGVTDESTTFFVARRLKKVNDKLGVGQEAITLHEVPLADLDGWLSKQMQAGTKVDGRVLAGVYLLRREFGLS